MTQIDPATLDYDQVRTLANSAIREIATALTHHADHDHWGDDCGDYFNACIDQLQFLSHALIDEDPNHAIDRFRFLLTADRDAIDDDPNNAMGFIYGYADHHTDISDLMRANDED